MAPRTRSRAAKAKTKTPTSPRRLRSRTHYSKIKNLKQKQPKIVNQEPTSSTTVLEDLPSSNYSSGVDDHTSTSSACSTPKAQRFRIPEILTCPPAPKKQRVMPNCSLQRRPIAFFAPPDLELFFYFALRDISV